MLAYIDNTTSLHTKMWSRRAGKKVDMIAARHPIPLTSLLDAGIFSIEGLVNRKLV
jgi:hypothetical protein